MADAERFKAVIALRNNRNIVTHMPLLSIHSCIQPKWMDHGSCWYFNRHDQDFRPRTYSVPLPSHAVPYCHAPLSRAPQDKTEGKGQKKKTEDGPRRDTCVRIPMPRPARPSPTPRRAPTPEFSLVAA